MLVYTMVDGESSPEGFLLPDENATVRDLLTMAGTARSAKNRQLAMLVDGAEPAARLVDLGITNGELVRLRATGKPQPDRIVGTEADEPVAPVGEDTNADKVRSRRGSRRRLSEYEELSQLLQWHPPYHMNGVARPSYEVWTDKSTMLRSSDWDSYRAPDKLYYRSYTALQSKADRAVHVAFDFANEDGMLAGVDSEHVERMRELIGALQYPEWGLCMLHQHATRFALSSWIAGATEFMMFDELRHAQLYGRLALAYGEAHGGFGAGHEQWMSSSRFQPVRQLTEEMLALLDWGQGIVVADVLFEPVLTAAVRAALTAGSARSGDSLTPFVCRSIETDKARHRADARAFLQLVCQDETHGEANRALVREWSSQWVPRIIAAGHALAGDSPSADEAIDSVLSQLQDQLAAAGVGDDALSLPIQRAEQS